MHDLTFSREQSKDDPEDLEVKWGVKHGCYVSEVFSLLNDNSFEADAKKYKVRLE